MAFLCVLLVLASCQSLALAYAAPFPQGKKNTQNFKDQIKEFIMSKLFDLFAS